GDDHVNAVAAIAGYPCRLTETGEAFFPLSRWSETMDTTVCGVGNVGPSEPVESDSKRLPWIHQQWMGSFVSTGRRLPETAQYESMQGKDADAMIAGIADEQVAAADAEAVRSFQLPRTASRAAETWNQHEAALAGIEQFQLRALRIE